MPLKKTPKSVAALVSGEQKKESKRLPGQRSERGEGGSPPGGQHDPAGGQQSDGQGCHGDPQPRHGGGRPQEK